MKITVYSHYFKVEDLNVLESTIVDEYYLKQQYFTYFKTKKGTQKVLNATYATKTEDSLEYRFHIYMLNDFKYYISTYRLQPNIFTYVPTEKNDYDIRIKSSFTLRPLQKEAIDFCITNTDHSNTKLVGLQTGEGKSLVSLGVCEQLKSRVVLVVRSQYVDKWYKDVKVSLEISDDEIYVARASKSLIRLLNTDISKYKAIIIPNRTFQNYISYYEKHHDAGPYLKKPDEYIDILDTKVLLIDEGHQDFHFNYILQLYTNVDMILTTTATLVHDAPFLRKIASNIYPQTSRFQSKDTKPYIDCYSVTYRLNQPKYNRHKSKGAYSHVMFEQSIMRHKPTMINYFEMIFEYLNYFYLEAKDIIPKDYKALIFCSTIDMCTKLTEYLRMKTNLKVDKYTQGDPSSILQNSNIIISTLIKAGVAVNIPNLYLSMLTIATSSTQANAQAIGRLRRLTNPTKSPIYLYFTCADIPQHLKYHHNKPFAIMDKVTGIKNLEYQERI